MKQILKIQENISKVLRKIPGSSDGKNKKQFEDALEDMAEIAIDILDLPENLVDSLDPKTEEVIFSFLGFVSTMEKIFFQSSKTNKNVSTNALADLKNIYDKYWMFKKSNKTIDELVEIGFEDYWDFDEDDEQEYNQ